jgi:hypothetical protein
MSEIISLTIRQAEALVQMMKTSRAYNVDIVAQMGGGILVGHNREYLLLAADGKVSRAKFEVVRAYKD